MSKSEGLGDSVEKIITKIGDVTKIDFIRNKKGCDGCRKRKEWLNEKFPYGTEDPLSPKKKKTCKDCGKTKDKPCPGCDNSK